MTLIFKLLVNDACDALNRMLPWVSPLLSFNAAAFSLLCPALPSICGMGNNLVTNSTIGCVLSNDEAIGAVRLF